MTSYTILLALAFAFTLIAAFTRPQPTPPGWYVPHFGWLGVSLYFLALLLGAR